MVDRHHMSSGQVAEWEDRIGVTQEMGGGVSLKLVAKVVASLFFYFVKKKIISFSDCVSG